MIRLHPTHRGAETVALPFRPLVRFAQNEERGCTGGEARSQARMGQKEMAMSGKKRATRTRLGVLWDSVSEDTFQSAERAAQAMRLSLRPIKLEKPPYDFEAAFRSLAQGESDSVLVLSSPAFTPYRIQIAELAIQHRLPTMFIFKTYVEAGGLMSYGVDPTLTYQRAASYIAKILRGAHPADLPVEQADKFLFALNLKTAKALGVEVPTSILLRADEVIE